MTVSSVLISVSRSAGKITRIIERSRDPLHYLMKTHDDADYLNCFPKSGTDVITELVGLLHNSWSKESDALSIAVSLVCRFPHLAL